MKYPNGSETLVTGTPVTIRWECSGIGAVEIRLERPGVKSRIVATAVPIRLKEAHNFTWTIPQDIAVGPGYKVRVRSTAPGGVEDASDGVFTITAPPAPQPVSLPVSRLKTAPVLKGPGSGAAAAGTPLSLAKGTAPGGAGLATLPVAQRSEVRLKILQRNDLFNRLRVDQIREAQRAQNSQPRPRPQGHAGGTDCDDQDKDVHPNAQEVCDGKDNDCDGVIDEGGVKEMVFLDADGDLHGDPTKSLELCAFEMNRYRSEGRWLSDVGNDCDDTDPEHWRGCE